jgi:hypothetical protein
MNNGLAISFGLHKRDALHASGTAPGKNTTGAVLLEGQTKEG